MQIFSNWKLLIIVYIVVFGLWGFIIKVVSQKLDWKTMMLYVWITVFIILLIFYFKKISPGWSKFHLLTILAGILAALGTLSFYKALSLAPASVVIPLSSQYILVTALLSVLFLKEPISLKIVAGIICSILAIILLSG